MAPIVVAPERCFAASRPAWVAARSRARCGRQAGRGAAPRGRWRRAGTARGSSSRRRVETVRRADRRARRHGILVGGSPGSGARGREVPDELPQRRCAAHPAVRAVSLDRQRARRARAHRPAAVGAAWVAEHLGFDGTGIGVAIIDSGVDCAARRPRRQPGRALRRLRRSPAAAARRLRPRHARRRHHRRQRLRLGRRAARHRARGAPVVLQGARRAGDGNISNVIAAIDYAIEQRARFNIRVINLSVAAGVYESYNTDPLTLAARARGRRGHRGRHRRGQSRPRRDRAAASTAASRRRATRRGC